MKFIQTIYVINMAQLATTPVLTLKKTTQWSHCSLSINHMLVSNYLSLFTNMTTMQRRISWEIKPAQVINLYFKLKCCKLKQGVTCEFFIYLFIFCLLDLIGYDSEKVESKQSRRGKGRHNQQGSWTRFELRLDEAQPYFQSSAIEAIGQDKQIFFFLLVQ